MTPVPWYAPGVQSLLPRILALASVSTLALACHTLTTTEVAAANGVISIGCSLVEGIPLPANLQPFAAFEPVVCAGAESLLAEELGKATAPVVDAGAGLGVSTAAMTAAGPKPPLRVILHGGQVVGLARVPGAVVAQ